MCSCTLINHSRLGPQPSISSSGPASTLIMSSIRRIVIAASVANCIRHRA